MPPYSLGDCGAHRPAFFALARTAASRSSGMFSCSEKFAGSASSGSTSFSTKARTRRRSASVSGESVKSMPLPLDLHDLPAIDHQRRAGDVAAGVGYQQQQCAVEITSRAEAAHRDVALELFAGFAHQIVVVDLGDEPAGGDGVDAHAPEGELDRQRLSDLDDGRLGGGIGSDALGDAEAEHRGDVDD